jgi:hypothetical protein
MLFILLGVPIPIAIGQEKPQIAPAQKSDSFAEDDNGRKIRVQHGELAKQNFQIAGIDLAHFGGPLKQAARILGPVETRATGDAASADERACYRPENKNDNTRLYFHEGEVAFWFVLSSGTPASERGDLCRPTSRVTGDTATSSGLHLGQTEEQVIAILGLPTRRSHNAKTGSDFMAYEFETKKKVSDQEVALAHKRYPLLNEEQLMESDYGYYDLEESIEATFSGNVLTKLRVNQVATD